MLEINYKKILLICALSLTVLYSKALTISGYLKANQSFKLFIGERAYIFLNASEKDSVIILNIPIKRITEVRYGISFNGGDKVRHTMILSPTDTVSFRKIGYDLIPLHKKDSNIFVDRLMEAGFYALFDNFNANKIYSKNEIDEIIVYERYKSRLDSQRLDSLYRLNAISAERKHNLVQFRKATYAVKLLRIIENAENFKNLPGYYDKLYREILSDPGYQLVDGDLRQKLFFYLAEYWVKKNSHRDKNLVDFYLVQKDRLSPDYISEYLLNYLKSSKQRENHKEIYKQNKASIVQYAKKDNQRLYTEILKLEKNRFFDMSQLALVDTKGNKVDLKKVVQATGKDYVFLDFWASWCLPCRAQLPKLEEHKKILNGASMAFVAISSDRSDESWRKALSEEKLEDDPLQFILARGNKPAISTTFFNIRTILGISAKVYKRFAFMLTPHFAPN